MSDTPSNPLSELFYSLKSYLDLRIDDFKLSSAEYLSRIISRLLYLLTMVFLLCLGLGFLCTLISRLISNFTGSPIIGPAVMFGLLMIAAIVIYLCRNRIFVNQNLRIFIEMFFGSTDDEDNTTSK